MRQIRDKYETNTRQISAEKTKAALSTDICSDMRHTWQDIQLQLMLCRRNYHTPKKHLHIKRKPLPSPSSQRLNCHHFYFSNNKICRPSQDMVFFQITGDRVTITNYWISHNTCNTLLPRLLQTQQQSNTLDG